MDLVGPRAVTLLSKNRYRSQALFLDFGGLVLLFISLSIVYWRVRVLVCMLMSLPFRFFISDYDNFLADSISKLILCIKAMVRSIIGEINVIILLIFDFWDYKATMIGEVRVTLGVPIWASRYRAALKLFVRDLSRCQIILLRVLMLIHLQLALYY